MNIFFKPQLNVPGFVVSLWEALPFLKSGWGGWGREVEQQKAGREGGLGLVCTMSRKFIIQIER